MARNYSLQGSISGRLGNMIGYRMFGRNYLRSMPSHYHDRRSGAQLCQRDRFTAMIHLAQHCVSALRIGLRETAARQGITAGNAFLRLNNRWFSTPAPGAATVIDYARLQFAQGPVGGVVFTEVGVAADGVVSLRWEKALCLPQTRNDDRVHIVAYCPGRRNGGIIATARRDDKGVCFLLPGYYDGCGVHLYAFVQAPNGQCSPTVYLVEKEKSAADPAGPPARDSKATSDGDSQRLPSPVVTENEEKPPL